MDQAPDELPAVRFCQARSKLRAVTRSMLAGSGLEIRDLERALVVCNPRDPDKGRIYISYATGEVSLNRTSWDYFGYLRGYARALEADPDSEPVADAQTIISALCGNGDAVS
jgi:hypothetical protein